MKFNSENIPINFVLAQNRFVQFSLHSTMLLFFKFIRLINKIFADEGKGTLVISLNKLGDTVFTIPAVRELYKLYPKNLSIICYPESVHIYKLEFPDITLHIINNDDFYFGGRILKSSVKQKFKQINPKLIVDLTGSMKSASILFNLRAKRIIGTNGDQFKTIYDKFVKFRESPKLLDIYLDVVKLELELSESKDFIRRNEKLNKKGKVLIHPFAGWKEKEWNLRKFIQLAERLSKKYPVGFVIRKNQLGQDIISEIENLKIDVIQTESVDELIQNIREASLFIGNDSGPVNVANYLNKPTITIYGATNPSYTETKYEQHKVLQEKVICSAGENEKFCAIGGIYYKCSGIQCMNQLGIEQVYATANQILNSYN